MRAGAPACTAGPAAPWRPHGRGCCAVAAGLRGMPPVASCCTSTSASNLGGRACEACLKYRDGPRRPFPPLRVHRYEILLLTSIDARLATNSPGDRLHSETRSGPVPKRLDSRAARCVLVRGMSGPAGGRRRERRADAGGRTRTLARRRRSRERTRGACKRERERPDRKSGAGRRGQPEGAASETDRPRQGRADATRSRPENRPPGRARLTDR